MDTPNKTVPARVIGRLELVDHSPGDEMLAVVPKQHRELVQENNEVVNKVRGEDRVVHDWYRFVLAFPPHLIRHYLHKFGAEPDCDTVFDPFLGCGTTIVEAKKLGFEGYGTDANPMAFLASQVKSAWDLKPAKLNGYLDEILRYARRAYRRHGFSDDDLFAQLDGEDELSPESVVIRGLTEDQEALIPEGFISPVPLAKSLLLLRAIDRVLPEAPVPGTLASAYRDFFRVALAAILVENVGNVAFGPEVYRTAPKKDAPATALFERKLRKMIADLVLVRELHPIAPMTSVRMSDARTLEWLPESVIDCVITSPPYPNEKDYTRSTRLESVLLQLLPNKNALRQTKDLLVRSNTRTIFKGDTDDTCIRHIRSINRVADVADEIEEKRRELNKTSGFERLYHRVVRLYFGGMHRHLAALKPKLRPGARCAYVVGDQMSFFQVPIKTGQLLAEVADDLGYQVTDIDLWRERRATATRLTLREEVVVLRKS